MSISPFVRPPSSRAAPPSAQYQLELQRLRLLSLAETLLHVVTVADEQPPPSTALNHLVAPLDAVGRAVAWSQSALDDAYAALLDREPTLALVADVCTALRKVRDVSGLVSCARSSVAASSAPEAPQSGFRALLSLSASAALFAATASTHLSSSFAHVEDEATRVDLVVCLGTLTNTISSLRQLAEQLSETFSASRRAGPSWSRACGSSGVAGNLGAQGSP